MNIDCLIPYFREDLITFPLWEEGDFRPTINLDLQIDTLPKNFKVETFISDIKDNNNDFWEQNSNINISLQVSKCDASTFELYGIDMSLKEHYNLYFELSDGNNLLNDNLEPIETSWKPINEQIDILVESAKNIIDFCKSFKN